MAAINLYRDVEKYTLEKKETLDLPPIRTSVDSPEQLEDRLLNDTLVKTFFLSRSVQVHGSARTRKIFFYLFSRLIRGQIN